MKPRQTVKNYHNSNVLPFQQNLPSAIASSSTASSSSSTTTTASGLRNIDLAKLGINLDDMPNLQANQDDFLKCIEAICGKESADYLRKPPTFPEWPVDSISPPDFRRTSGGGGGPLLGSGASRGGGSSINNGGGSNNCANVNARSSSGLGYNNNIVNVTGNNFDTHSNSGQPKLSIEEQLNSHHLPPSCYSSSNITLSKTLPPSQDRAILSFHQQHQNDLNNRRLNHLNTTSASFANLNTASSAPITVNNSTNIMSNSSGVPLDPNNLNSFILEALGPTDKLFDMPTNVPKDTSNNQQSLIKHQQLQRLLMATGRPTTSTPPIITTTTTNVSSHRSDMMPQRNISSNNMTSTQHPTITTQVSTITPPHTALSSVPKSLLNLAACSSTSPTSTNSSSLPTHSYFSSMVNQLNLKSGRNNDQTNLNRNNSVNSRSAVKNSINDYSDNLGDVFNQRSSGNNLANQNSLLQHSTRSNITETNNNPNNSGLNRSSSKQLQWSLLSEDQSPRQLNPRTASNKNLTTPSNTPKTASTSSNYNRVSTGSSSTSKEAYLADLQERAARAGVSIGEINKPIPPTNVTINNSTSSSASQQGPILIPPNQSKDETFTNNLVGRKEIESALSRVEARNDLSLLYPPMLLAANSQKQINALSAGLQSSEDTELFTSEVKKIILEECNIIYECKECNNLFRSLANLVKHKRTYCLEHSSDRLGIDMNKRSYANATTPVDQSVTTIPLNEEVQLYCDANLESRAEESTCKNSSFRTIERRCNNLSNDLKMLRMMRNQPEKKGINSSNNNNSQEQDISRLEGQKANASLSSHTPHAILSRILQNQPKNRLPTSRDNALMGTLNLTPTSSNIQPKSAHNGTKNMDSSTSDVDEQLIRNSSLAKTILDESVKKNPTESLIMLQKMFSNESDQQPSVAKRPAPKRNLEDCIKKVKRDKLLTEDDEPSLLASQSESSSSEESSDESSSSEDSSIEESSSEEVKHSVSSKKASPTEDQKSPTEDQKSPTFSDSSDSQASADSESLECETSPIQPVETAAESEEIECGSSPIETTEATFAENEDLEIEESSPIQEIEATASSNESSKQIAQKPSSSNKSAIETTPSSSNASGSGGIMKLKIQLKTTPDEKSKVYEIAR